jgi:hypothetical protein
LKAWAAATRPKTERIWTDFIMTVVERLCCCRNESDQKISDGGHLGYYCTLRGGRTKVLFVDGGRRKRGRWEHLKCGAVASPRVNVKVKVTCRTVCVCLVNWEGTTGHASNQKWKRIENQKLAIRESTWLLGKHWRYQQVTSHPPFLHRLMGPQHPAPNEQG